MMVTKDDMQNLYDYYLLNGDNEKTWYKIIKELKNYIDCQFHSSNLYYSLYDDAYSYVVSSIPVAFKTFKNEKNANIYTWTTRLFKQAIWRYVRDTMKQDEIYNVANNDMYEYEVKNLVDSVEDNYISKEKEEYNSNKIDFILKTVLRCDIYYDVYCLKKGLFGNEKIKSNEDIAEYLNITLKTVTQANTDNKLRMVILKKFLSEHTLDELNKESFESFRQKYLYKK